jgi:D-alanine transaminase
MLYKLSLLKIMNTSNLIPLPCYLNGQFTTIDKAQVSVMDRGFIFGDGVYEVVPLYAGKPFRMDDHLSRLEGSLAEMRIANPKTRDQWIGLFKALAEQSDQSKDYLIYLQITRGIAMRDHVMPDDIEPTVFAFIQPIKPASAEQRAVGVSCVSAQDFRWSKAHIKSTSLLGSVFSRQISADVGSMETIMFRGDNLSEAAASNVWIVKDGKVLGAKSNHLVLRGIRYGLLETLCSDQNIAFELRDVDQSEVLNADEILLSSATKEVLPVTKLDGRPVGNGKPGPIYAALFAGYQRLKNA